MAWTDEFALSRDNPAAAAAVALEPSEESEPACGCLSAAAAGDDAAAVAALKATAGVWEATGLTGEEPADSELVPLPESSASLAPAPR